MTASLYNKIVKAITSDLSPKRFRYKAVRSLVFTNRKCSQQKNYSFRFHLSWP